MELPKIEEPSCSIKNQNQIRRNGFHAKYVELCKSRNANPVQEVKMKQNNYQLLDFHCDRIKLVDWFLILNALIKDESLESVSVKLRKNLELVQEEIDCLVKANTVKERPIILTKYMLKNFIGSFNRFLSVNPIVKTVNLEGLPISGKYMVMLCKGLTDNKSIKSLSLARSMIEDDGCETLCSTIKHLPNIESLNLSNCNLTVKGAESVANLIKFQKIQRFSEGWEMSLRYRVVNPETIPGLNRICLSSNPQIGDEGLATIIEILKEDAWIKDIEMQNCKLTDISVPAIIKCLHINKTIKNFNIRGNPGISEQNYRHIIVILNNADQENSDSKLTVENMSCSQMRDRIKFLEEQVETEIFKRTRTEELNEKLHAQLLEAKKQLISQGAFQVPEGHSLILTKKFETLIKDQEKLQQIEADKNPKNKKSFRNIKKTQSDAVPVVVSPTPVDPQKCCKSESVLKPEGKKTMLKVHFEKTIGDQVHFTIPEEPEFDEATRELDASASCISLKNLFSKCSLDSKSDDQISFKSIPELIPKLSGSDILEHFMRKKINEARGELASKTFNSRGLYLGRPEFVPNNSEDETESL